MLTFTEIEILILHVFTVLSNNNNVIDGCIHFTFDIENDNSLSILDALIPKYIDRFSTTVFKQCSLFSLSIQALSNRPSKQKTAELYAYVYSASHNKLNYLESLAVLKCTALPLLIMS